MINQSTIDKLIEMRLSSMADASLLKTASECLLMLNIQTVKTTG